jgi:hypothetical protein
MTAAKTWKRIISSAAECSQHLRSQPIVPSMSRYLWCGARDSYTHLAGFAANIQQGSLARKLSAPSTLFRTRQPFQGSKNLAARVAQVQEPSSMPKMAEKGRHSNGAIVARWKSAQRPRNALRSLPPGWPRSLGYRKGDRRMSPRKPPAAPSIGCYVSARWWRRTANSALS